MSTDSRHLARPGFTLVELMISVAIVLVLLVGINQVFQYTVQAVGAGQSLSATIRDSRAAQTAFATDLAGTASDGPFFLIHSAQVYAFRNRADFASDVDQDAHTYTVTTADDTQVLPSTYNFRNHRIDVLSFFARGNYAAQTGYTQLAYPNVSSQEARIWYGMLKLPDNNYYDPVYDSGSYSSTQSYRAPGLPSTSSAVVKPTSGAAGDNPSSNPNNFFATDWVLGRVATLLLDNPAGAGASMYLDTTYLPPAAYNSPLSPLAANSLTNISDSGKAIDWESQWSRCDVAKTSISSFNRQLKGWIEANDAQNKANGNAPPYQATDFWTRMFIGSAGTGASGELFQCNPFVSATTTGRSNQMAPYKAARATPYFLKGCTQFAVEFAGDFVQQDNVPTSATYGQVTDIVTTSNGKADGIDFYLDASGSRHVRWYGLPRNPTGTPLTIGAKQYNIPGNTPAAYNSATKTFTAGTLFTGVNANYMQEVVPLRDVVASSATAVTDLNTVLAAIPTSGPQPQWIERYVPPAPANGDYGTTAGMANNQDYVVAWGPDTDAAGIPRPKLIRITFTLDTGNPQIPDGQTYEYVYALP